MPACARAALAAAAVLATLGCFLLPDEEMEPPTWRRPFSGASIALLQPRELHFRTARSDVQTGEEAEQLDEGLLRHPICWRRVRLQRIQTGHRRSVDLRAAGYGAAVGNRRLHPIVHRCQATPAVGFRKRLSQESVPSSFGPVVTSVREFLSPAVATLSSGKASPGNRTAPRPWI